MEEFKNGSNPIILLHMIIMHRPMAGNFDHLYSLTNVDNFFIKKTYKAADSSRKFT